MNWTGIDVFDRSISRTNTWLKDFMQELNTMDRRAAFFTFCDVLHAVRDHLTVEAATRFGNELPLLLRGAYFENWDPQQNPTTWAPTADDTATRAVFRLLKRKADQGEIQSVEAILPQDLRDLWPPTLRAA